MTHELNPPKVAQQRPKSSSMHEKGDTKNTVKLFIESAYVGDEEYAVSAMLGEG